MAFAGSGVVGSARMDSSAIQQECQFWSQTTKTATDSRFQTKPRLPCPHFASTTYRICTVVVHTVFEHPCLRQQRVLVPQQVVGIPKCVGLRRRRYLRLQNLLQYERTHKQQSVFKSDSTAKEGGGREGPGGPSLVGFVTKKNPTGNDSPAYAVPRPSSPRGGLNPGSRRCKHSPRQ